MEGSRPGTKAAVGAGGRGRGEDHGSLIESKVMTEVDTAETGGGESHCPSLTLNKA